jgi:PHD/YefM family antitoxin component YafN of YafNO toxin-antitoxin module
MFITSFSNNRNRYNTLLYKRDWVVSILYYSDYDLMQDRETSHNKPLETKLKSVHGPESGRIYLRCGV